MTAPAALRKQVIPADVADSCEARDFTDHPFRPKRCPRRATWLATETCVNGHLDRTKLCEEHRQQTLDGKALFSCDACGTLETTGATLWTRL